MIGILEEIGMSIEDLEGNTVALGEEIDAISDDLSDVEKAVFDEDDDDDDCCCGDEEDDFFEVDCPNCGDTLMIDESVLEEGVIQCPGCRQWNTFVEEIVPAKQLQPERGERRMQLYLCGLRTSSWMKRVGSRWESENWTGYWAAA